jgi:hypothetical protein
MAEHCCHDSRVPLRLTPTRGRSSKQSEGTRKAAKTQGRVPRIEFGGLCRPPEQSIMDYFDN